MTIEETIQSLKPGDRVRVTWEATITRISPLEYIEFEDGTTMSAKKPSALLTSIEVIEHPLQVGDLVHTINGSQVTILAIAEDHAMIKFRDKSIGISNFKNLKRI